MTSGWDQLARPYGETYKIREDAFHLGPNAPGLSVDDPLLDIRRGGRVLDLGCGAGHNARFLARNGYSVTAVDKSRAQVTLARELGGSVTYFDQDMREFLPQAAGSDYDFAYAVFSLEYVDDLFSVFHGVRQALGPDGRFLYVDLHPAVSSASLTDVRLDRFGRSSHYFVEGPRDFSWQVAGASVTLTRYHRTLSTLVDLLMRAGLSLRSLQEPPIVEDDSMAAYPDLSLRSQMDVWSRFPYTLVLEAGVRNGV